MNFLIGSNDKIPPGTKTLSNPLNSTTGIVSTVSILWQEESRNKAAIPMKNKLKKVSHHLIHYYQNQAY